MKPSVAIFGGGVGGLSAAHELAERGFAVTCTSAMPHSAARRGACRSPAAVSKDAADLPAEHGFRFFPGFYKHVTDTMRRIPFGTNGANCRDNLVQATRILLARQGKLDPIWVARFPETLDDFRTAFFALFDNLDIPHHEIAFFVTRLLALATSCEERFREEYEQITFWDFIGANARSENYRRYLGQGMTRSLVAMRAEESSTRTVGRILLQLFYGILVPGRVFDRLLGRADERRVDRSMANASDRPARRDADPQRNGARVQPGRRPDRQRLGRAQRSARCGDRRLPCRRDAGGSDAAAPHAGADARGAIACATRVSCARSG